MTLRGETLFDNDFTKNKVTITSPDDSASDSSDDDTTIAIIIKTDDGTQVAIYNIDFNNKDTKTTATAIAADLHGLVAAYGSSFIGYQNTLLLKEGTQVFSNCYIEGSTAFIWGFATAFFYQSYIASNTAGGYIAAQSRPSAKASGGFVFDTSLVTYTSSYGDEFEQTYLGHPYSEYSLVIYMGSYLDKLINPTGWHEWSKTSPRTGHVVFGEYNNSGPGRWSSSRASFAKKLSKSEASDYTLSNWIGDTSWLDMKAYNLAPSYDLTGPNPATPASGSATPTSSATSPATATWAHPSSGTTPPAGAILVSEAGSVDGSYSNLTDALDSLPSDDTTQIIFIYPGSYDEQVPSIDRDGAVMIIGYTKESPGKSYINNKVTITFSRGLSISPRPKGHTDSETATISTASNKIAMYNINVVNTDNLDGSESSYVTVAAAIYGSHIGFYGCSFVGWQETLLTGSEDGYQYYESSYIEGAIDIITGSAKAYFKGCTIGAKKPKSAFTAQSRASSKAIGGYIFDQCFFGAAFYTTVDLSQSMYLGRPYSDYALVVVKYSYLTNIINPAGWEGWSEADPRTDHVTFAEYKNNGPGNWENNKNAREGFGDSSLLTSDSYSLEDVMDSTDWIDFTYWDSITTPQDASSPTSTGSDADSSSTGTSTAAYDGTTPPTGAYIVSTTSIADTTTYDSVQDALDALPSFAKKTNVIFIYPGTYKEQLEIDNLGTVILIGYSEATKDFSSNQVTIKYKGASGLTPDDSIDQEATASVSGNRFEAININFVNSGAADENTASVAFAVKPSSYASLFGSQVIGGQDALLINGYFFASNTYIEGQKDMILGSGAGYFLNSTISPNEDDISLTADQRDTGSSLAGFVFDQSTIAPASGAGSLSEISLGRPGNSDARVAYINSYIGSLVEASGWEQQSSSSPQTSDVLFGEYGNFGPGSDTSDRAPFATQLDDRSVAQFEIGTFFASTDWIDLDRASANPFKAGKPSNSTTAPSPSTTSGSSPGGENDDTTTTTTTIVVTDDGTTQVTSTDADKTSTVKSTTTVDVPPDASQTATGDSTITSTATITRPTTVTSTENSADTADGGEPATVVVTVQAESVSPTTTLVTTVVGKGSIRTVKSTTTTTTTSTDVPAVVTSTETSTTTSTKTANVRTSKVTSTVTRTSGTGGTTTKSARATTVTSSSKSTKKVTESATSRLSCIPASRVVQGDLRYGAVDAATKTESTSTQFAKTSTVTVSASVDYVTDVVTETSTGKADADPRPQTVTAFATQISTVIVNIDASGAPVTTRKPSTSTETVSSVRTETSTTTLNDVTIVTTSVMTITRTAKFQPPPSTVVTTKVKTAKAVLTLPAVTSTKLKTTTLSQTPSVTLTSRDTSTKTQLVKATSTTTNTVTATAKGATTCAA